MKLTYLGKLLLWAAIAASAGGCTWGEKDKAPLNPRLAGGPVVVEDDKAPDKSPDKSPDKAPDKSPDTGSNPRVVTGPIDPFMAKGLRWLVEAQAQSGGWGGGSHAHQDVRDPHAVPADPGTTAFVGMALIRAGHTPFAGDYKESVARATEFLLGLVEAYPEEGPKITDLQGTQPQVKLGQYVDTSLAAQYFTRLLPHVKSDAKLEARVTKALAKCVKKIEKSQKDDGSWNHGGWAPVLQSSMANNALEGAKDAGLKVDDRILAKSREYQRAGFDEKTGRVAAAAGAGVELYGFSSNQRANAKEAGEAERLVAQAKADGKVAPSAPVDASTLRLAGVDEQASRDMAKAYGQRVAGLKRLDDEALLQGFGNNGGEEFLSYMLTSESLVGQGGEPWEKWNGKVHERLSKIQNPDGSWSGHHCISSPVFCTAAVTLCLTADRDATLVSKALPTTTTTLANGNK